MKRQLSTQEHTVEEAPQHKRTRRSHDSTFDIKTQCLFCGVICDISPDSQNPKRWKRVVRCRTAPQGDSHDFKKTLLGVCDRRNNILGEVRLRLQGIVSDLHAADAIYHKDSYAAFSNPRAFLQTCNR